MKAHWILGLTLVPLLSFGNCDISCFRWQCEIPLHMKPSRHAHSLVYCGNTPAYVTKRDYFRMTRYQRANINMILTIDEEYIDSPCLPAHE